MSNEPEHLGVFIIVIKDGRVLLGKRKNAYKSGLYGCPGGRLELTESLIDCAKRELLEETGVKALDLEYLGVIRELQDGYNFIHFGFVCRSYAGEVKVSEPDKCESWKFFDIDQIPANTLPAHKASIELFKSKLPTFIDLI